MMRARWWALVVLTTGVLLGAERAPFAAPVGAKKEAKDKDAPKADPAIKNKVDLHIAPFKWGITSAEAMTEVEKQIDEVYQKKIGASYNPKTQANLEKERDRKKHDFRDKLMKFSGNTGVSGYEVKAPGEFTYKNNESALEVPRTGAGIRQLFFIGDKLWKVYDHVPLGKKEDELGDTWESAVEKMEKDLGVKGKLVSGKSPSPSYFGVMIQIPPHYLWSDGTTQVRLVDHTKREDQTDKTVGVAYEQISTLEKLPALRTNVEQKASDPAVDRAGYSAPMPKEGGTKKKSK
jgi:hypothetical protein